jgi:prevent-host-death family protein
MHLVGVRELKDRLTFYLNSVKAGENVVVTDRGKPVAILHGLDEVEADAGIEERLASLAAQGTLTLPNGKGAFCEIKRAKILEGGPISESLIQERR